MYLKAATVYRAILTKVYYTLKYIAFPLASTWRNDAPN